MDKVDVSPSLDGGVLLTPPGLSSDSTSESQYIVSASKEQEGAWPTTSGVCTLSLAPSLLSLSSLSVSRKADGLAAPTSPSSSVPLSVREKVGRVRRFGVLLSAFFFETRSMAASMVLLSLSGSENLDAAPQFALRGVLRSAASSRQPASWLREDVISGKVKSSV